MKDLSRKHWDLVTIHNIDDEDFVFEYDSSSGNTPYIIIAGEVKRFPRFLANHAVKHLVNKIITKEDMPGGINNMHSRNDLMERIVVGEESFQHDSIRTEEEQRQDIVDRANKPSEIDKLLDKRRLEEKKADDAVKAKPVKEEKEEEVEEKFEGLEKTKEVVQVPTRREIYSHAKKSLNMVIDEQTKKRLDKMSIKQLLVEVGDPREDIGA